MTSPSPWQIGASLASVVVAVFAIVEMVRIYINRREVQNRAAAQVSAVAIPIRRQIKSWLSELPTEVVQMEQRLRKDPGSAWSHDDATAVGTMSSTWNGRSIKSEISKAEERIEHMNAEAPFAKRETRATVVAATAAFYRAFDYLNQIMALPPKWEVVGHLEEPAPRETREHGLLLSQGHQLLQQCVEKLDAVIDEQFEEARKQLEAADKNPAASVSSASLPL